MLHFNSAREKRLWILALAVLAAIYSTAGFAGTLAEVLRENNLLNASFGLGFVLVIVAIVGNALKKGAGPREIWVTLGVAAVWGMVVVRLGVGPAERSHLFEFGLLAVLVHEALIERRGGRRGAAPAVFAVVATALLGWIDEGIQALIPGRVYDVRDVGINALAGLMAISASLVLAWARRRLRKR